MTIHKQPLVTIVTPSFNQGPFIEETILSIRNQDYPQIEHLVMDAGSTDETVAILKRYEDKLAWVSEPDRGQSDAINKGWQRGRGEILAFINSDDILYPGGVRRAVDYLTAHPEVDFVYGAANFIDEHGELIEYFPSRPFDLAELVTIGNYIPQQSVFIRRSVFEKVGGMDLDLYTSMDYDYWLRCALAGCTMHYIPHLLGAWRIHSSAKIMAAASEKHEADRIVILDRFFGDPALPPALNRIKDKAYSKVHIEFGFQHYNARKTASARRYFVKAARIYPGWLKEDRRFLEFFLKSFLGTPLLLLASRLKNQVLGRVRQ